MSVIVKVNMYPAEDATEKFLGAVSIEVEAEGLELISKIRGVVRRSKYSDDLYVDARNARAVEEKGKSARTKDKKWYDQVTLGSTLQRGIDAAVNLGWRKISTVRLEYNPSTSKWRVSAAARATKTELLEGADELLKAAATLASDKAADSDEETALAALGE